MLELVEMDDADAAELFIERGWTDGLPVVVPTPDRVEAMLAGGGVEADEVLGTVPAKRRTVTAGLSAVNAVMAGCKPDYFPIVLASLRGMLDPLWNANGALTSTGGSAACIVVSGPMAREMGLNAKGNLFGPGYRANATIGRAVRLVAMNVIGARPGMQDESSMANPGKYSLCFAEEDPAEPWQPLRVQLGFDRQDTTVTIMATEAPRQIGSHSNGDAETLLRTFVSIMKAPATFIVGKGGQGIIVLGPEHQFVLRDCGWTQDRVRAFLTEQTRVTPAELVSAGVPLEVEGNQHYLPPSPDGKYPTIMSEQDLLIVTAGGHGAGWSAYIPAFSPNKHIRAVTRRVRPAGEALPDCGPDSCEIVLPGIAAAE
jgi:hypothetical protein